MTLRNFEPIKNYYISQPKEAPERQLVVPIEAVEPCEKYHSYHLEGIKTNRAFIKVIQFNNERKTTDMEKEIWNTVKASITEIPIDEITNLLAHFLPKDGHFLKEYKHYRERTNHPKQTEKL